MMGRNPRGQRTPARRMIRGRRPAMTDFNRAVDEYLHGESRSRPWTQKQEEDTLRGLAGWMHDHVPEESLEAVTGDVLSRYADERSLSAEELDDLHGTVASMRVWARHRGDNDRRSTSRA
jgi:hypothetical protein